MVFISPSSITISDYFKSSRFLLPKQSEIGTGMDEDYIGAKTAMYQRFVISM